MLKLLLTVTFMLLLMNLSKAQVNLVPNPSFEVYDTCPSVYNSSTYRSIYNAVPWFQPFYPQNSTDYFNACNSDTSQSLDVPLNYEGYQVARTGVAYAGFSTGYFIPQNNVREYVEVELADSLIAGKNYCISFFISFADFSRKSTDGFGAFLSNDSVLYNSPNWGVLNLIPQISNTSGNIISDTLNWTEISGEFIAVGGEKFLTIGNFKDDAHSALLQNNYGIHPYSYYYIDDVSVILCDSTVGLDESLSEKSFIISPNPSNGIFDVIFDNKNHSVQLNIHSIEGKLLRSFNTIDSKTQIDLSDLNAGIYLLEVVCEDKKVITKKIIISK